MSEKERERERERKRCYKSSKAVQNTNACSDVQTLFVC